MTDIYKKVSAKIKVPVGKYCWQRGSLFTPICEHFDNVGGNPECELRQLFGYDTPEDDGTGPLKLQGCLKLPEGE